MQPSCPLACARFLCSQNPGLFSQANPSLTLQPQEHSLWYLTTLDAVQMLLTSWGLSFLLCEMGTVRVPDSSVGEDSPKLGAGV